MICHRERLIFVHLRRTAGNSIEAALGGTILFDHRFRRTFTWNDRLHRGRTWHKLNRRGTRIHATAAEIWSRYPREFERYFRFSIVRNPWAQMASLYARLHGHDPRFDGFRDWLAGYRLVEGTVPQDSLHDDQGNCLVDFIGRFERLEDYFDEACDRAGIPRRTLPRTNSSPVRPLAEIYDTAAIRTVARLFEQDIDRFGYTFAEAARLRPPMALRRAA